MGVDPASRKGGDGPRRPDLCELNIAYGPESVDGVVRGWLDSPGHCANIMDARFTEMGIAEAAGRSGSRRVRYWVQELAEPRG